jgi:hypothetical protein
MLRRNSTICWTTSSADSRTRQLWPVVSVITLSGVVSNVLNQIGIQKMSGDELNRVTRNMKSGCSNFLLKYIAEWREIVKGKMADKKDNGTFLRTSDGAGPPACALALRGDTAFGVAGGLSVEGAKQERGKEETEPTSSRAQGRRPARFIGSFAFVYCGGGGAVRGIVAPRWQV